MLTPFSFPSQNFSLPSLCILIPPNILGSILGGQVSEQVFGGLLVVVVCLVCKRVLNDKFASFLCLCCCYRLTWSSRRLSLAFKEGESREEVWGKLEAQ